MVHAPNELGEHEAEGYLQLEGRRLRVDETRRQSYCRGKRRVHTEEQSAPRPGGLERQAIHHRAEMEERRRIDPQLCQTEQ